MGKIFLVLWIASSMVMQQKDGRNEIQYTPQEIMCSEQVECASRLKEALVLSLRNMEEVMGVASQIDILDLQYRDGALLIDLSEEVVAYGGGNEAEYQVLCWLLKWGFEEVGAESITILVEGKIDGFPEGSQVHQCTRENYTMYYKC